MWMCVCACGSLCNDTFPLLSFLSTSQVNELSEELVTKSSSSDTKVILSLCTCVYIHLSPPPPPPPPPILQRMEALEEDKLTLEEEKVALEEEKVSLEEEVASLRTQLQSAKVTVLVQQHYKYVQH